jgi:hypothetical protein
VGYLYRVYASLNIGFVKEEDPIILRSPRVHAIGNLGDEMVSPQWTRSIELSCRVRDSPWIPQHVHLVDWLPLFILEGKGGNH